MSKTKNNPQFHFFCYECLENPSELEMIRTDYGFKCPACNKKIGKKRGIY